MDFKKRIDVFSDTSTAKITSLTPQEELYYAASELVMFYDKYLTGDCPFSFVHDGILFLEKKVQGVSKLS